MMRRITEDEHACLIAALTLYRDTCKDAESATVDLAQRAEWAASAITANMLRDEMLTGSVTIEQR